MALGGRGGWLSNPSAQDPLPFPGWELGAPTKGTGGGCLGLGKCVGVGSRPAGAGTRRAAGGQHVPSLPAPPPARGRGPPHPYPERGCFPVRTQCVPMQREGGVSGRGWSTGGGPLPGTLRPSPRAERAWGSRRCSDDWAQGGGGGRRSWGGPQPSVQRGSCAGALRATCRLGASVSSCRARSGQ